MHPDGSLMAWPIAVSGATLEPGRPVALFRTRIVGGGRDANIGMNYDIARDGRFLIRRSQKARPLLPSRCSSTGVPK